MIREFKIDKPINKVQFKLIAKAVKLYGRIFFCGRCKDALDSFREDEDEGTVLYVNDSNDSTHVVIQ